MNVSPSIPQEISLNQDITHKDQPVDNQKFGTFLGVFIPCILMLFGVIIFLRLGWIVGLVGLAEVLVIITLAAMIAMVTTLSMAAISTNIQVGNGGVYYMLSRSLGIEVGAAIGLPLYFRQALTIAFCCIGFAESLHDLMPNWSIVNIGIVTLAALTLLAYTSVRGALKVQVVIFVTILASLLSLFTGGEPSPMAPETFTPSINTLGFWAVFAIFFPAMTGVESSVSLSGDLRNPSKSLPVGTISAILVAYLIYIGISLFISYHVPMDRLVQDPLIMQDIASIPSLIIVGIWGATLSSALGGLLSAPRTLQAISEDGMAPKMFSKTFGAMNEPRVATIATCIIAFFGIYFGSVNVLAPLLTMVSLICYAVLNLSAGMETLMANPSWRPRFPVHWSISLSGAALCLIVMLMIGAGAALISLSIVLVIYLFVKKRQHKSTWTDIRDGLLLFFLRSAIYRLAFGDGLSKSWRPHFLVFTKSSEEHSTSILSFAQAISQSKGFLTMASFVKPGVATTIKRKELSTSLSKQLKENHIHALVQIKEAEKVTTGMHNMIEHYGLGPLSPNTIVFGGIRKEDESLDFVNVLTLAYRRHNNVVILNELEMLDHAENGELHIWWDDDNQNNSDLMLVLGYMIQLKNAGKQSRISIKAIVEKEVERQEKLNQLLDISQQKRLPLNAEVYVAANPKAERASLIKEFSKNADLIFLGLKPPSKDPQTMTDYMEYLHDLSKSFEGLPIALIMSSEHTPLESILN